MMKWIKRIGILVSVVSIVYALALVQDRQTLRNELVRLHVVGASDSPQDQSIKLSVRDAVLTFLSDGLRDIPDIHQATQFIQAHLPEIQETANNTLRCLGAEAKAVVQFIREEFPARDYDTFSLPSGIYQSLRIIIGEGTGQNWWCVVFPALCMGATGTEVEEIAAGAGFSQKLMDTITGGEEYRIRFYLLDALGRLENFFYRG